MKSQFVEWVRANPKKSVLFGLIGVLIITKPDLKAFEDFKGGYCNEATVDQNYFVLAVYDCGHETEGSWNMSRDDWHRGGDRRYIKGITYHEKYIGVLGNFISLD